MEKIFNQVEELTGTYPTGDNLRKAIYATIWLKSPVAPSGDSEERGILRNVELIARTYEQNRGTTQVALPRKTKSNPAFDEYMHPEEAYKPDF